uniref:Uncharacterized protein n=1 Tax=Rhizophora mucronata TaxID=61149 RepID=A0A2P2NBE5_RHIMU
MGPAFSPPPAGMLAILTLPNLSERPRTMPENHAVEAEEEEEEEEAAVRRRSGRQREIHINF